jgi:hypothetical protein
MIHDIKGGSVKNGPIYQRSIANFRRNLLTIFVLISETPSGFFECMHLASPEVEDRVQVQMSSVSATLCAVNTSLQLIKSGEAAD